MRFSRIVLLLFLILLAGHGLSKAATQLEGYSELFAQLSAESRVWRLDNPQLLAELRFKSAPWPNTEAFLKTQAFSNKWEAEQWENFFFIKEGHLKFRGDRIETYIFTGQDRFWINEPLLNIVSQDVVKDDWDGPKAQGMRLDFWDTWGFTGTAFYSDKSTPYPLWVEPNISFGYPYAIGDLISTDDHRAARVKRSFLRDRMILGSTYARKDYSSGRRDYDEVAAADFEVALGNMVGSLSRLGRVTLIGEGGKNTSGWLGTRDPYGWKIELRDVGVGPLTMIANLYDFDDDFYTLGLAKGDIWDDNDYYGHYLQLDYRLPRKAINLKGWRSRGKPHTFTSQKQPFEETGGEIYVEFIHGFTGKIEYKRHINKDGTWPNVFFEVSGENRIVKIRAQFRIKDMNTDYELRAFGFEANANLTEQWKFYTRLLTVDEKTEARETVFAQIQYTGWQSAEFFVEFGDWQQSNDLVNDDWDFVNHGINDNTRLLFKAFMRLYY